MQSNISGVLCGFNPGWCGIDAGTHPRFQMLPPGALGFDFKSPAEIKNELAYDFFSGFFTHYLPKRFIHHYIYGNGLTLTLSEQEMADCNPLISLTDSKEFIAHLRDQNSCKIEKIELNILAGALTNGTLGQFTVQVKGMMQLMSMNDWKVEGSMSFHDFWDFDPKSFLTGGRSFQGEIKTRFAHYTLPGQAFSINSVTVPFSQTSNDNLITWSGGTPTQQLDKVAADYGTLIQKDVDLNAKIEQLKAGMTNIDAKIK